MTNAEQLALHEVMRSADWLLEARVITYGQYLEAENAMCEALGIALEDKESDE